MKITYKNWMFDSSRTEKAAPTREQSLSCESISADTLTVVVRCDDPSIMSFQKNDAIRFWENDSDASMQTYYLRSIERTGATAYKIVAWSAVGLLATIPHKGGIYTGQTVSEVIPDICGAVPVVVKSVFANVKLYGWLPYCQPKPNGKGKSARDNLALVLFAIGAYLTTDLNGVLHIDSLWDGTASIIQSGRMYLNGGKVGYTGPISAVTVTEHQYVAGTEVKELFSGTAQNGDIITFSEPMHSLSATGFAILESGANYAKISAGTGALTGKAYIHNTRLITQPVTAGAVENIKSVTDATLVSLVNSYAVAKRLADYYRCRETITNDIVSGHEKPGHVVSVYHPYDKKMVSACIQSLDTTMSATLKSSMEALVGFTPAQPEQAEYFSERVLLTGSGTWTPPEGAEAVTAVLIGDGQDGTAGQNGEGVVLTGQTIQNTCSGSFPSASAGKGGKAGSPGSGGKIFQITMDITPGISFSYATSQNGEAVFGSHSSAEGSASPNGYYDDVTGKTYARKGAVGYDGGDGGAPGKSGRSVAGYKGGYGSQAEEYTMRMTENNIRYTQTFKHQGIGGPGAAMGTEVTWDPSRFSVGMPTFIPNIRIVGSAPGASAVPGADGENYGDGGGAGHGGGGAGGIGSCSISMSPTPPSTQHQVLNFSGDLQHGGSGSSGGKGKPGCIILFYGKKKTIKSGPLVQRGGGLFFDRLNKLFIV